MANISFGERMRRARIRSAITQSDLAEKIGVTQATVSNWEKGRTVPDAEQKANVRRVLGDVAPTKTSADEDSTVESGAPPFGAWLNRSRVEKQMSIAELAEAAGVSSSTVYKIEVGMVSNTRPETVRRLEAALGARLPEETKEEIKEDATIKGVGELIDFDPHVDEDLPSVAGIYVFYDVSDRPIYVGQGGNIRDRIRSHREKFWFRSPITETAAFVQIDEKELREKVETLLIRFMKSNAVVNKKNADR